MLAACGSTAPLDGDSAYGSREARAAYRDGGHDTVIKPGPLQPADLRRRDGAWALAGAEMDKFPD